MKEDKEIFQELLALQEIHSFLNSQFVKEDKVKSLDKHANSMEDHIVPEQLLTVITKDAGTIKNKDKHLSKT